MIEKIHKRKILIFHSLYDGGRGIKIKEKFWRFPMLKEIMLQNDSKCQITSNNILDIMDNPNGYGLNEDSVMMISANHPAWNN